MFVSYEKICQGKFKAMVSKASRSGHVLAVNEWRTFLQQLPQITQNPDRVFKTEGADSVILKYSLMDQFGLNAVIKTHQSNGLLSFLKPARAFKNFKIASRLARLEIPAEYPLGAFVFRDGLKRTSIYITEYFSEGVDLKNFLRSGTDMPYALRVSLASQLADTFARLHQARLWHRDAKHTNILLVSSTSGIKANLIDLDGIRRYPLGISGPFRYRSLITLAASLIPFGQVSMIDYWRTFEIYCDRTGIARADRKYIFRELVGLAMMRSRLREAKRAIKNG